MSSIKDLFVSIKVKSTGVDKLQELNRVMRTTLSLMKEYNKNIKDFGTQKAEKTLVKSEREQNKVNRQANNKDGFFAKAPNILAVVMLTRKLTDFISKIGQLSYELLKLSRNFGVSTTAMQKFGYEAVANGVKMDDFNSAIATLKKNSADIMLGRGDISPYALLGLNPHEDPEKLLISLQRRLRELPESIGTAFASDLGLSMDMINYIRKADFGRTGSRALLSSKELSTLERARNIVLDLKNTILVLIQKIGVALSPIINTVFGGLNSLIQSIITNTRLLGDVFTVVFGTILAKLVITNPILSAILTVILAIEDFVKTGGRGISLWLDFITLKIRLLFAHIKEDIEDFFGSLGDEPDEKGSGVMNTIRKFVNPTSDLNKNITKWAGGTINNMFFPSTDWDKAEKWMNRKSSIQVDVTGTLYDRSGKEVGSLNPTTVISTDLSGQEGGQ